VVGGGGGWTVAVFLVVGCELCIFITKKFLKKTKLQGFLKFFCVNSLFFFAGQRKKKHCMYGGKGCSKRGTYFFSRSV